MKILSNYIGSFQKNNSVSFENYLWASTNGTIDWSKYPKQIPYTEQDIFHTELRHNPGEAENDIGWTIRIGKGGHIYYIDIDNYGQIICPQRYMSPWNDDCMTTTVFSYDERNEDPEVGGKESFVNGYIHGSGMYIKTNMDPLNNKPFYNPILGEQFDINDRSYTIINWGLVPKPNINRGDVLFYSKYRDLGFGVLELNFYNYNFGDRHYNFAETPWWAVRPSKLPNMIEGVKGTSNFIINNKKFGTGAINSQGGWGAWTNDPTNPESMTCALVWGSNNRMGVNFGIVDTGVRDMALMAPSLNPNMPKGTGYHYRRYAVFGKLKNVVNICESLNNYSIQQNVEFFTENTGKIPLYKSTLNGQSVLNFDHSGVKIGYTYCKPIKNSIPLFLMKDKSNNTYFVSTDPYAICTKIPFANPYPPTHEKFITYQNRHLYQIYDDKTEWVQLLGFALPLDSTKINNGYQALSTALNGVTFIPGETLQADQLMILSV